MWEKVVFNLLSNALKFTFSGTVSVRLGEEDGHAVLRIADTAVGVPTAEIPRLCDRFHRDFYGAMSDALNRGDRSDRLVARWDLDRAIGPSAIPSGPHVVDALRASGSPELPKPERGEEPDFPSRGIVRVAIPADYLGLRERDPGLASAWRDAVGEVLEKCFDVGMIVVGLDRDPAGPRYVLAVPATAGGGSA